MVVNVTKIFQKMKKNPNWLSIEKKLQNEKKTKNALL